MAINWLSPEFWRSKGVLAVAGWALSLAALGQAPPRGPISAPKALPVFDRHEITLQEPLKGARSLAVDATGGLFLSVTGRWGGKGVFSTQERPSRMDEDVALQTVRDRVTLLRGWLARGELDDDIKASGAAVPSGMDVLRLWADSVVRVVDPTNRGEKLALQTVPGALFGDEDDGPISGVAVTSQGLAVACGPNLWLFRAGAGGQAPEKVLLATGLGVRIGDPTHGLGPVIEGPDGRIYFAVGDRGFNVRGPDGRVFYGPTTGGVFRCWPDGEGLELLARGLRAPRGLAFDEWGELFVLDGGLYWVHPGMDARWEATFADTPGAAAAWAGGTAVGKAEMLGSVGENATAIVSVPGSGFPAALGGGFVVAETAGLRAVQPVRAGAGFSLPRPADVFDDLTQIQALTVQANGTLVALASPTVEGHGRLFGLSHASSLAGAKETVALLRESLGSRPVSDLVPLLAHADGRVRFAAQKALVGKGWRETVAPLSVLAVHGSNRPAQAHALWALGELARSNPMILSQATGALDLPDEALKIVACRVFGDAGAESGAETIAGLLRHPSAAVRCAAATALAKLRPNDLHTAVWPLVQAIGEKDEVSRSIFADALARSTSSAVLREDVLSPAPLPARLTALLALRRQHSPVVADFLGDPAPAMALEAVRTIYDSPIEALFPKLSELLDTPAHPACQNAAGLRRLVAAALWLGRAEDAVRVAAVAAREPKAVAEDIRLQAAEALENWDKPSPRDRVNGRHLPPEPRIDSVARKALLLHREALAKNAAGTAAEPVIARLLAGIDDGPKSSLEIITFVGDDSRPEGLRLFHLRQLDEKGTAEAANVENACRAALHSATASRLRAEARAILVRRAPAQTVPVVAEALAAALPPQEKQAAVRLLDRIRSAEVNGFILKTLGKAQQRLIEPAVLPDLLELAQRRERHEGREGRDFREVIEQVRLSLFTNAQDPLAAWRPALDDGDLSAGAALFRDAALTRCQNCHALNGRGAWGPDAVPAPDLAGVGSRLNPPALLEAVVRPGARLAPGFVPAVLKLADGTVSAGLVKEQGTEGVAIRTVDGVVRRYARSQVAGADSGESPCRPMGTLLTLRELRDLMTFLRSLR